MRYSSELSIDDLQTIFYWYTKAFENKVEETGFHKNILIKVQAMATYTQEAEESSTNIFRKRLR